MNIFDHLIPDKYILGIGCLDREFRDGKIRFYFDLHLVSHTATIKSEWFYTGTTDEDKKAYWKEHYEVVRQQVANLVGEPTDERKQFEETINKVYQESIDILEDIEASVPNGHPWKLKAQRLSDNISELKTLALK